MQASGSIFIVAHACAGPPREHGDPTRPGTGRLVGPSWPVRHRVMHTRVCAAGRRGRCRAGESRCRTSAGVRQVAAFSFFFRERIVLLHACAWGQAVWAAPPARRAGRGSSGGGVAVAVGRPMFGWAPLVPRCRRPRPIILHFFFQRVDADQTRMSR